MSLEGNTQIKVTKRVLSVTLVLIGAFLIGFKDPLPYVYGIIFGVVINILNFRLMSLTLEKSVKMPKHKIMPYVLGNYMARYIIYGVVLTVGAIANYLNFYTVILGLFMVKIVILSDTFFDLIRGKKKIAKNN
ncbi:ATP synthase subunit I [Caldisalinibacter kiritimatiensis]|uniref:ATP synthase protein I2 n=1 Tax=Caldisalinibacter kiritimatiensis TaxID=1304284 RepID=R1CRX9_9FIRM|nr:ATP synthase subunit I [Caldisalinibacter kiritimatiensis]EOC99453.1 hypothetical protein L21TH_2528 [Caldisalinibacter kiritimatiensis]